MDEIKRTIHNGNLVWVGGTADDQYWDDHWKTHVVQQAQSAKVPWYLKAILNKLDANSHILEAGCGTGAIVSALNSKGYKTTGIDIATKTVEYLNSIGLPVEIMDVLDTTYENDVFDAYISLGVIEHFHNIEDTKKIIKEATRITKKGGYLYFSVPFTNRIRKSLIEKNELINIAVDKNNFYQRSFDSNEMSELFSDLPLNMVCEGCYDAPKGIADEVSNLRWLKKKPWRIPVSLIERHSNFLHDYGHMLYQVYQKK